MISLSNKEQLFELSLIPSPLSGTLYYFGDYCLLGHLNISLNPVPLLLSSFSSSFSLSLLFQVSLKLIRKYVKI